MDDAHDPGLLHSEDHEADSGDQVLRPSRLDEFQGQAAIKANLKVFIEAAKAREDALDHVFISGPPGLGKTTLASIMAHELGVEFRVTSAPAVEKPKDVAGILTAISPKTVFFIDEIHRLKPAIEEMLYIAMEDYELDWIIGQGPAARTIRIPVPPFTLVGATTKAGLVSGPLFSRFGINVRIDLYGEEEIANVLRRSATILGVEIDEEAIALTAACSRGTPRVANRLLRRLRDFAQVLGDGNIDKKTVETAFSRLEIDTAGLEAHDREILRTIIQVYQGGPVGAETLAVSVGEAIDTLEDFYEPYLIRRGLLKRTPRGRVVTGLAYRHLGLPEPESTDTHEDQRFLF